jgi:putative ABC transport system permease protein
MKARDLLHLATESLARARMRSLMMLIAMAIGVASVVVLTSLGEGARRYVTGEFRALGTDLLIVLPGRSETTGIQPGMFSGETPRDLTLGDAKALLRLPDVERIAPLVIGSAPVSAGVLSREVPVIGTNSDFMSIRNLRMAQGDFLPPGELDRDMAVCVIGSKVRTELFPRGDALGQAVRVGERRFRVIGILGDSGRAIGFDLQELVLVPVSAAQQLFNTESLFRILVQARDRDAMRRVQAAVRATLIQRHQGEEDVTVITQDAVLATFDRIFTALTLTLAGIASISLAVAGLLITAIVLAEAILLSIAGATAGLLLGYAASWVVGRIYPSLPVGAPVWAVLMAVGIAVASGVVFGLLPARRAARLDPVAALSGRK